MLRVNVDLEKICTGIKNDLHKKGKMLNYCLWGILGAAVTWFLFLLGISYKLFVCSGIGILGIIFSLIVIIKNLISYNKTQTDSPIVHLSAILKTCDSKPYLCLNDDEKSGTLFSIFLDEDNNPVKMDVPCIIDWQDNTDVCQAIEDDKKNVVLILSKDCLNVFPIQKKDRKDFKTKHIFQIN